MKFAVRFVSDQFISSGTVHNDDDNLVELSFLSVFQKQRKFASTSNEPNSSFNEVYNSFRLVSDQFTYLVLPEEQFTVATMVIS